MAHTSCEGRCTENRPSNATSYPSTPSTECQLSSPDSSGEIVFRNFASPADYEQGAVLQMDTWGSDFTQCVPASILQISQKMGGVTAGAFDKDDHLVGFIYGLSGLLEGRPAHWSHMLATRPEYRGTGIGRKLKTMQRDLLLAAGIDVVYWTFDPLIAGNAHFNINLLGVRPLKYVADMYGNDTGSELHSGLGTDRLIVEWNISDTRVADILRGEPVTSGPTRSEAVTDVEVSDAATDAAFPTPPLVRVAIPLDIHSVKQASRERALTWRAVSRQALLFYMEHGYDIAGFQRDETTDRGYYYLSTKPQPDDPV